VTFDCLLREHFRDVAWDEIAGSWLGHAYGASANHG
jgi:hypothetical protein